MKKVKDRWIECYSVETLVYGGGGVALQAGERCLLVLRPDTTVHVLRRDPRLTPAEQARTGVLCRRTFTPTDAWEVWFDGERLKRAQDYTVLNGKLNGDAPPRSQQPAVQPISHRRPTAAAAAPKEKKANGKTNRSSSRRSSNNAKPNPTAKVQSSAKAW